MSLGVICKTTKGNAEVNKMSVGFTKKKKKDRISSACSNKIRYDPIHFRNYDKPKKPLYQFSRQILQCVMRIRAVALLRKKGV